ncbi:hypothetical protein A6A04_13280 [Paramagnetospirillum marisnigri]|uniref:Uncharacterized protein n=1 Tax=Paramagnetospirillum marisnigri TaxID=1285242 RepID=A0A178MUP3_9PROT|nr:hypothetical protein [Paramagnetospirillum marisnigri]OAN53859.1 hypothetical protein A6A04_13280 [Paramagnetospirillum marisnigri]
MNHMTADIGHNQPPSDIDILRGRLAEENADVLDRRDALIAACDRIPPITTDEIAGKVGDHIKQMTACIKAADGRRVAAKEPFLESGRAVDGFFKSITDPLDLAKKAVERNLTTFLREKEAAERRRRDEEARIAREAAERKAAEARAAAEALRSETDLTDALASEAAAQQQAADAARAEKEASAKAADLSRTRGDYGAVSSLRTTWEFDGLNRAEIDLEALRPYLPLDGLEKAVRAAIKSGVRELRGVNIFQATSATVR